MSHTAVLQVVILRDGLLVGTEALTPGTYSIGSGAEVELRLDDPTVSDAHALLYFQNGRAAIQDSGSYTGVYVNGHKVSACEIRSVDEILIGPFVLKVRVLEKKDKAQKPAPPPELAAMLGSSPPPKPQLRPNLPPAAGPAKRPASAEATVASARKLQAVPQGQPQAPASPPIPLTVRAPHLRPVPPQQKAPEAAMAEDVTTQPTGVPFVYDRDRVPTAELQVPASVALGQTIPSLTPRPFPAVRPSELVPERPSAAPRLAPEQLGSKKAPRLHLELYWGGVRKEARAFRSDRKGVKAAATDTAQLPLYGFTLPEEQFQLAEPAGKTFRVFVPPNATVERASCGDTYRAADAEGRGSRRFVTLSNGQAVRFSEGALSLVAYVAPPSARVRVNPLRGVPWLLLFLLLLFGGGAGYFVRYGQLLPDEPDFQAKALPPVAVRLIAPEKRAKAKEKLEELKKKAEPKKVKKEVAEAKKVEKKIEESVPKALAQAPETKALKALAKLSAAGPMKDLLAATDKLGNGPGDKKAKNSDYKLSGLIGKQPIANAGIGLYGKGGGGASGGATMGMEVLRGKGGGGIGALGAKGVGKGQVGGVVARASARSLGVQGSIDREAVAKTVNSHLQEVRGCYERALLKDPALAGKVVLEWTISTKGIVTAAKTKSSTLKNAAVESCILSNLKTWRFPPAKGGQVIVSYPFLFNSVGY